MTKSLAALLALLLFLPGAAPQDPDKEKAKEEQRKKDEDAKAVLKTYHEMRQKGKTPDDAIEAVQKLQDAEPHVTIRNVLLGVLQGDPSIDVRIAAASALGSYKRDTGACDALLRNAKIQKDMGLRKKCIQRFGAIAPFGKSMDLFKTFVNDESTEIVKEMIEAVEEIKSIRMLRPLVDLLGELEQIREDKGDSGGGGPPLPGVPQNDSTNNQKLKRKKDLTDPTRKAINTIYKKYDSKAKLNTYTEAIAQLQRNKSFLTKLQEEEDRRDKGVKDPGQGYDSSKDGKGM
jgi:hypothetical protein